MRPDGGLGTPATRHHRAPCGRLTHHTAITATTQDSREVQRRGPVCSFVALSKASLIGAIVTGRVLGRRLALTARVGLRTSAGVNIELAAERPRAVRRRRRPSGC